jgi:hypothetical protein
MAVVVLVTESTWIEFQYLPANRLPLKANQSLQIRSRITDHCSRCACREVIKKVRFWGPRNFTVFDSSSSSQLFVFKEITVCYYLSRI